MLAFDTETFRFRSGVKAPELVCLTWCDEKTAGIRRWDEAEQKAREFLDSGQILVGQYVAYDCSVLCANFPDLLIPIFKAYDEDRITCTKIREQLIDIAYGKFKGVYDKEGKWHRRDYDLASMVRRYFGKTLDKDLWRTRYSDLHQVHLSEWPEGAKHYALEDAQITHQVAKEQERFGHVLQDQYRQARASFWLTLSSNWGARTSLKGIEKYFEKLKLEQDMIRESLVSEGFLRKDGTRNIKRVAEHMIKVCEDKGLVLKLTEKKNVCLDSESCRDTEDPLLLNYALFSEINSSLTRELPMLKAGVEFPIHTSYGLAATGRTTSSKPNIQNVGKTPGVREAFVPRPGMVFVQADYEGLELHTLAQVCLNMFGHSKLAEVLNAGEDPHLEFAAKVLKISYSQAKSRKGEPEIKAMRSFGKIFNFGKPGGLGDKTLIEFAKSSGVHMTLQQAKEYNVAWLETFPEMREYFAWASKMCQNKEEPVTVEQLYVNRYRTITSGQYTASCNTLFQGLGADIAKQAGWLLTKQMYTDKKSVLYGARIIAFVHDEFILEAKESRSDGVARELERLMIEGASKYLPDVKAKAPPIVMRYWSKEAVQVQKEGRIVPWPLEE